MSLNRFFKYSSFICRSLGRSTALFQQFSASPGIDLHNLGKASACAAANVISKPRQYWASLNSLQARAESSQPSSSKETSGSPSSDLSFGPLQIKVSLFGYDCNAMHF